MATRRTPEEIERIVDRCIELEQSGGDILAYMWGENYLTPRATWCNFQREWLGRKPYEYTDGKPRKEEKDMARIKKDGTPAKKPWPKPNYKKVEKKEPEQLPTVKIDGPILIETPEANQVKIVEKPEKPKITQPVTYDGMVIREVEGTFGRYRYTYINNGTEYIDFENSERMDILSLSVEQWKKFREEQEKAALILGVEL